MKVRHMFRQLSRHFKHTQIPQLYNARAFISWDRHKTSDWSKAVSDAEKIVGYPTSFMSLRCLLSDELANVAVQVRKLVGTKHPLLKTARGFLDNGKHSLQTRGLMVLLIAKAAGAPGDTNWSECHETVDEMVSGIYPSQRQLAEITEMIHTANLVHKGVVNLDTLKETDGTYRDMEFGNKIAVLSGDFLLTSAITGLAELNNTQVVELISMAIGDMTSAEFTCLKDRDGHPTLPESATFKDWEKQAFLQSGSLLARSCQSAMALAGHSQEIQTQAALFGENIAYAKQMNEDIQPFLQPNADMNGLLSSAPVIHHAEVHGHSSIDLTVGKDQIISTINSDPSTVDWCKQMCKDYGDKALHSLNCFEDSDAKTALTKIVQATTVIGSKS